MDICIKGATSTADIEFFKDQGITSFTFDSRPRSFNFLQAKNIEDIISKEPSFHFRLLFEQEELFVIENTLDNLNRNNNKIDCEILTLKNQTEIPKNIGQLSFYYHPNYLMPFYQQFSNFETLIFPEEAILILESKNELFPFLDLLKERLPNIKFEFLLNWNFTVPERILLDERVNKISLEINNDVQQGYRVIDQSKIAAYLSVLQRLLKL